MLLLQITHRFCKAMYQFFKKVYIYCFISLCSNYILSRSDHPVVKLLRKHQYRLYNRLYPIVSKGLPQSSALTLSPSRSTHNLLHPGRIQAWCYCGGLLVLNVYKAFKIRPEWFKSYLNHKLLKVWLIIHPLLLSLWVSLKVLSQVLFYFQLPAKSEVNCVWPRHYHG